MLNRASRVSCWMSTIQCRPSVCSTLASPAQQRQCVITVQTRMPHPISEAYAKGAPGMAEVISTTY